MLAMVTERLWQNKGPALIVSIHLLSTRRSSFFVGLAARTTGYCRTDTLAGIVQSIWRLATGWTVRNKSRWGRDFSHPSPPALGPIQPPIQWVPGLSGGKAAGAWRWPPTPSSAAVKERVYLYLYSSCGLSWPVLGWILLQGNYTYCVCAHIRTHRVGQNHIPLCYIYKRNRKSLTQLASVMCLLWERFDVKCRLHAGGVKYIKGNVLSYFELTDLNFTIF
jgi:hypothetical protein